MRHAVDFVHSATEAFLIYIVWVSLWSVWTSADKAYKKQELIERNLFRLSLQKTEGCKVLWL